MKGITLNGYQAFAWKTAIYPRKGRNTTYPVLGLCGESGEVAEKVKKAIRDDKGQIMNKRRKEIVKELGDVLWYVSAIASELRMSLDEVAKVNMRKLVSRARRGKLHGSGDNR